MPRPFARASVAIAALLAASLCARAPLAGDPAPVTLAEVASQVDPSATQLANLKDLLRTSVEAELRAIDWSKQGVRRRYTLSAAVVSLSSSRADGLLRVSCTVSAAVRDRERGTILATLQGRARVEGAGAPAAAEQDALAGAVRSAVGAVPDAIRRAQ